MFYCQIPDNIFRENRLTCHLKPLLSFVTASRIGNKHCWKGIRCPRKEPSPVTHDDPYMIFGNVFYSMVFCCLKYFRCRLEKTNNLLKISLQKELSPRTYKTFITPSLCCKSLAGVDNSV